MIISPPVTDKNTPAFTAGVFFVKSPPLYERKVAYGVFNKEFSASDARRMTDEEQ